MFVRQRPCNFIKSVIKKSMLYYNIIIYKVVIGNNIKILERYLVQSETSMNNNSYTYFNNK